MLEQLRVWSFSYPRTAGVDAVRQNWQDALNYVNDDSGIVIDTESYVTQGTVMCTITYKKQELT